MSRSKSKWDLPEERRRRASAMADLGALHHEGDGHGMMQASSAMRASVARLGAHSQSGGGRHRRRLPPLLQFLKLVLGGLAFASVLLVMLILIDNASQRL